MLTRAALLLPGLPRQRTITVSLLTLMRAPFGGTSGTGTSKLKTQSLMVGPGLSMLTWRHSLFMIGGGFLDDTAGSLQQTKEERVITNTAAVRHVTALLSSAGIARLLQGLYNRPLLVPRLLPTAVSALDQLDQGRASAPASRNWSMKVAVRITITPPCGVDLFPPCSVSW